jgi:hypothetical protein
LGTAHVKAGKLTVTLVPHYSVAAASVADIQAAVRFASDEDLYLVVKNTGHDQYVVSYGVKSVAR